MDEGRGLRDLLPSLLPRRKVTWPWAQAASLGCDVWVDESVVRGEGAAGAPLLLLLCAAAGSREEGANEAEG